MLVKRLKDGYIFELENVDVLKSLLEAKEIEEVKEVPKKKAKAEK